MQSREASRCQFGRKARPPAESVRSAALRMAGGRTSSRPGAGPGAPKSERLGLLAAATQAVNAESWRSRREIRTSPWKEDWTRMKCRWDCGDRPQTDGQGHDREDGQKMSSSSVGFTSSPTSEKESREDRDESPRPGTRDGEGGQEERAQEGG